MLRKVTPSPVRRGIRSAKMGRISNAAWRQLCVLFVSNVRFLKPGGGANHTKHRQRSEAKVRSGPSTLHPRGPTHTRGLQSDHRGGQVLLVRPFHGWSQKLDGGLVFGRIRHRSQQSSRVRNALGRLRAALRNAPHRRVDKQRHGSQYRIDMGRGSSLFPYGSSDIRQPREEHR